MDIDQLIDIARADLAALERTRMVIEEKRPRMVAEAARGRIKSLTDAQRALLRDEVRKHPDHLKVTGGKLVNNLTKDELLRYAAALNINAAVVIAGAIPLGRRRDAGIRTTG